MTGREISGGFQLIGAISLPGERSAAGRARRYTVRSLGGDHPLADDLALAVSELFTNAVRHSDSGRGGRVRLALSGRDKTVRAEVTDDGTPRDRPHIREAEPGSGHGLKIVDSLGRWGVIEGTTGRTTWFEIDE